MARWLVKEEPTHYSFADLRRDGSAEWDGVHNALALRHLKAMRRGDEVLYYHSGGERSVVGIARVAGAPYANPSDDRGSWSVRLAPVRTLATAVPLSTLKADAALTSFDLVRIGRLSVMPVSDEQWARVLSFESKSNVVRQSRSAARRPKRRAAAARKRSST
ncbi:MAG: EVE domain-containing protein [Thermoplasmata archaeon]|nr:EVE domain-containing protein [Thermoplasmata archaeon]